jgi:GNAT superfamily N-acetyltransferase
MRGSEPPPEIPTNLEIRELAAHEADRFGAVVSMAFGLPAVAAPWTAAIVGRPGWRAYGAFDHDALVAAGALFVEGDVGWLGMAGTLPFHRRRGAQGALMVRRIADAIALGCTTIATETGILPGRPNPSLDNMLRCGFAIAYERPVWSK